MNIVIVPRSEKETRLKILLSLGTLAVVAILLWALPGRGWWPTPGVSASIAAALLLALFQGIVLFLPRRQAVRSMRLILVLPLVVLVDLLQCERQCTVAAAASLAPLLLSTFLITGAAWSLHDRLATGRWPKPTTLAGLAALPVLLPGFTYLFLGVCAGMGPGELQQLLAIGLAVTYANLGAAIAIDDRRLDVGLVLRNARHPPGDGKTVRGTLGGLALATVVVIPAGGTPLLGLYAGLAALSGNAAAAFLKRRFALPCGELTPLLDQWDTLIPLLLAEALWGILELSAPAALLLVLATLFVRLYANAILYFLGRKQAPWSSGRPGYTP